jgi:hypothetical protein
MLEPSHYQPQHYLEEGKRLLKELQEATDNIMFQSDHKSVVRRTVNKRTHRIRFEDETEDEVTIVIEKRED